jgi:hypothetical protein
VAKNLNSCECASSNFPVQRSAFSKRSLATRVESSLRSPCSYPDPGLSSLSSHISTGATGSYRAFRAFRALFCTGTNTEDGIEMPPQRCQGKWPSKRTRISRYKARIYPIRIVAAATIRSSGRDFSRFLRFLRTFLTRVERRGPPQKKGLEPLFCRNSRCQVVPCSHTTRAAKRTGYRSISAIMRSL